MIELPVISQKPECQRKPSWLKVKLPIGQTYKEVRKIVDEHKLHTICQSDNCPDMGECWGGRYGYVYDIGECLYPFLFVL